MGQKALSREEQRLKGYIDFLKQRKQPGIHSLKYERVLEQMDEWKALASELFEIQLNSGLYNEATNQIITLLRDFVLGLNSEQFLNSFQNKCTLDQFLQLEIDTSIRKFTKVSYEQCARRLSRLMQIPFQIRKKSCRELIIEKEIMKPDHIVMEIVNHFNKVFTDFEQMKFIVKFQIEYIHRIYGLILHDLAIKTIFKSQKMYMHALEYISSLYEEQIEIYKLNLNKRQNMNLQDLEARQEFWMEDKSDRYIEVIQHLNLIMRLQCPVAKFEAIGELRHVICLSLDSYYCDSLSKQIQIDSDHFLIILIYALIHQNRPTFLGHIRLIQFAMPQQIESERGDTSWVYVSLIAAIEHIMEGNQKPQQCLEQVIKSQIY